MTTRADRLSLLLLVALQLAVTAAVMPRGDFPLNDDWAYAHSVLWLVDEHRVRLSNWIGMNLLPQTLVGGLAAAVFGFSFETLRHVTQIAAALASASAYAFFRVARLAPRDALVATVAVIAVPCWPVLANSYMTDLYGLLFALLSATLFLRALDGGGPRPLLAATLLAALGVLQRQVVAVVPFAFMIARLVAPRLPNRRRIVDAVMPFAFTLAAGYLYRAYLARGPGVPEAQRYTEGRLLDMLGRELAGDGALLAWVGANAISMGGLLGLFSAGWVMWWGWGAEPRTRYVIAGGAAVLAACALALGWLPPYRAAFVLDAAGIGPFTLYDGLPRETAGLDRSPGFVWRAAGVAAAFGVVALVALTVATASRLVRLRIAADPTGLFLATVTVAYLAPFVVTDYFDRYLLFVLPFVFALWARTFPESDPARSRLRRGIALVWMLAVLGLGAAATHDYFAWNRARWEAIRTAERMGATPETLDGGFEYNGFHRYEQARGRSTPGKSWWWVDDDRFVVAFSSQPGYDVIETIRVARWLPRSPNEVKLLRRIE